MKRKARTERNPINFRLVGKTIILVEGVLGNKRGRLHGSAKDDIGLITTLLDNRGGQHAVQFVHSGYHGSEICIGAREVGCRVLERLPTMDVSNEMERERKARTPRTSQRFSRAVHSLVVIV